MTTEINRLIDAFAKSISAEAARFANGLKETIAVSKAATKTSKKIAPKQAKAQKNGNRGLTSARGSSYLSPTQIAAYTEATKAKSSAKISDKVRRSAVFQKLCERVLDRIAGVPGQRSEEIADALGIHPAGRPNLKAALQVLREEGKIASSGVTRGTTWAPASKRRKKS